MTSTKYSRFLFVTEQSLDKLNERLRNISARQTESVLKFNIWSNFSTDLVFRVTVAVAQIL